MSVLDNREQYQKLDDDPTQGFSDEIECFKKGAFSHGSIHVDYVESPSERRQGIKVLHTSKNTQTRLHW